MTSTSPQKYVVIDGAGNSFELMDADGTPFPAYFSEDPEALLSDVKNMAARDDDVFIVAYPKAGMKRKKTDKCTIIMITMFYLYVDLELHSCTRTVLKYKGK